MANSIVTFVGTKAVTADSTTGWSAGSLDIDSQVENTGCVGLKISANINGYHISTANNGSPYDFNNGAHVGHHIWAWLNTTGGLDIQTNGGLRIRAIADAVTDAVGEWYVGPPDGYGGGWLPFVIDPSLPFDNLVAAGTPVWTLNGNPTQLDPVNGFGGGFKVTRTVSGNIKNTFVDAISVGLGYRITNGDGVSDDAKFTDITTFESISTNKYGAISSKSGVIFPTCKIYIGFESGAGDTNFTDSGFIVIWENARVASDFYELKVQKGTGSTTIAISSGTLAAVAPTEVFLNFTGGTSVTLTNINIDHARLINFDSACTMSGGTITNSGTIDLGGSPTISNVTVRNSVDTIAMDVDSVSELDNVSGITFDGAGVGGSGSCAIRLNLGIAGPFTIEFDNIVFTNRVSGSHDVLVSANVDDPITINVVNGGSTPTINNLGSSTVTVNNTILITLTGLKNPTEVRIYKVSDGSEVAGQEDVVSGTFSFSSTAGTVVDIRIFSLGYQPADILNYTIPTTAATLPIAQFLDRSYVNP